MLEVNHNYEFAIVRNEENEPGYKTEFVSSWDNEDLEYVAEDAAKHYYDDCGGFESTWPIKFMIFENDEKLGVFEVNLEYDPTFEATEL